MGDSTTLSHLFEASASLEDEATVVRLAARSLWEACPRGFSLAYTIHGHPARSLGAAVGIREGAETLDLDLERFRRVFERAALYYDRYRVDRAQRGRWVDLPADWFRRSAFYPLFRPFGVMGRNLVCLGSRPLGCAGLLLPDGAPGFTPDERRQLGTVTAMAAGPMRVAALLAQAAPALDAVDHLMESRTEAAFLFTGTGRLLARSTAGQRALDGRPSLSEVLADVVRQGRTRARTVMVPDVGVEIHVTPCSPRGTSAAYLAILAPHRDPGRERLTRRQSELLELLELGLSNRQIAERLSVGPATVKTMLERLYRRAGVSGRVALLRWSRERASGH
jgi:DNA-binding CsgD family transcriptional regulator